jgi:hypothetical protein
MTQREMPRNCWLTTAYYGHEAKPPKQLGQLAIEVWNRDRVGLDLELATFAKRHDIGEVVTVWVGPSPEPR